MAGKILKISSNDLYGNVDERKVVVFACFEHTKYMNNYVIFSFLGEYNKKKLYFGSIHMKEKSLVIFSVKDNIKSYIDQFLSEYLNGGVNNFKILDIKTMDKVELVSYNEMDYDKLELLDDKSIHRARAVEQIVEKKKQPVFLYFLIVILVMLMIGLTILYLKPDLFRVKYKELECSNNLYDDAIKLYYDVDKVIKFDKNNKLESIDVIRTYTFEDSLSYYGFRNNASHYIYFNDGEGYKYLDEELRFKVFFKEKSVIDDYDEMLTYLNREGFSCVEREYEK